MAKPEPPPKRVLVTVSAESLRAIARFWYHRGFKASGFQCHGEKPRIAESESFARLLDVEFDRQYSERHPRSSPRATKPPDKG